MTFSLREMCENDLRTVLKWRNHKANRTASLRPRPITIREHINWFTTDRSKLRFLFTIDQRPTGVVIFDTGTLYWSIYLDPEAPKGDGLGTIMAAIAFYRLKTLGYKNIKAVYGSEISQKFHEKCGFVNGERSL